MLIRRLLTSVRGWGVKKEWLTLTKRTLSFQEHGKSLDVQFSSLPVGEEDRDNVLQHEDYFSVRNAVTVKDLFDARVHYGHNRGCRHHSMQPYIFGNRNGVDIINLDSTQEHLIRALNFLSHVVYAGGMVLFVVRSHIHGHMVELMARECGEYAQTRKWYREMFLSEQSEQNLVQLPDICVFLSTLDNVNKQHDGVIDCAKINIPTVGIVDTNSNSSLVTYPVPGNDDSVPSIELYCKLFKSCVLHAKEKRNMIKATPIQAGE